MHWCPEFAFCGAKSSKLGTVPSLKRFEANSEKIAGPRQSP